MKGRKTICFSLAVIFCTWLSLGVFVKGAPADEAPDYPSYPDPLPDAVPDPQSEPYAPLYPDAPAPESVPDVAPPEPAPESESVPDIPPQEPAPEPESAAPPEPAPEPESLPDVPPPEAGPEPESVPDVPQPEAGPEPESVPNVPEPGPDDAAEEDLESESESESDSDSDSDSPSDSDESDADPYPWLKDWQRRIIELNHIVYRLQGENRKLQHAVHKYDKKLEAIQGLESSLSNEVETWLKGMQFPGLARVHDAIGIKATHILNSVGEEAVDCEEALSKGHQKPGVYLLNPSGSPYNVRALCVNGWTIVQRRFDGTEDFNREFDDYMAGFGNFSSEFFLGLENLHIMGKSKDYTLRVDAKGSSGKWYYGVYEGFGLTDEKDDYRLSLGNMTAGNYFDGFANSREQQFSTRERDNDNWRGGNCAAHYGGGWWSNECITNLNQMWCKAGCLRWADKRVISSIIRIKPSAAVVAEDLSENPNPGGLSLDEVPA